MTTLEAVKQAAELVSVVRKPVRLRHALRAHSDNAASSVLRRRPRWAGSPEPPNQARSSE